VHSATDLVWFKAPTWEKNVILGAGATTADNVTLAPFDIDRAVYVVDREGALKSKTIVDDGGMATEDLIVGDFKGDKLQDIVASERSTRNIKIYWNETKRRNP